MRTLFERLKPEPREKVMENLRKYPITGESLINALEKQHITNVNYGYVLELHNLCNSSPLVSFIEMLNLFEDN
jgi:hypothetical protein